MAVGGYPPVTHYLGDLGFTSEVLSDTSARGSTAVNPHVSAAGAGARAGVVATLVDVVDFFPVTFLYGVSKFLFTALALAFCAAGSPQDQARITHVLSENDQVNFAAAYLKERGLDHWAEQLETVRDERNEDDRLNSDSAVELTEACVAAT